MISDCQVPAGADEPRGEIWRYKFDPAVAFDGVNYLVTWVDFYGDLGNSYTNIYAARVSPAKIVLDPNGIGLSGGAHPDNRSPSLVFGGSMYFVVWLENRGGLRLRAARVTPEGSVLDPFGFTISAPGANSPVDAFDGTNFLAVWDDSVDVLGTRVTQAGAVLDGNGFQITTHGPPLPPPPPPPCSGRITIPEIGPADQYPSTCSISGLSGTITDANLVLNGLSHFTPDDIDILLVGPQGQDAIVMSMRAAAMPSTKST